MIPASQGHFQQTQYPLSVLTRQLGMFNRPPAGMPRRRSVVLASCGRRSTRIATIPSLWERHDLLGRVLHDRVTTLGSGVDGVVRRISMVYLCLCQLEDVDFFPRLGTEERVGGPGGGASSPWSPAGGRRKAWQDARAGFCVRGARGFAAEAFFDLPPRGTTCRWANCSTSA